MEIGEKQDIIMDKLKALQHSFNEESAKSKKEAETIQVLNKDLKLAKAEIKSADNSHFLY